jgi:hypothetical protein
LENTRIVREIKLGSTTAMCGALDTKDFLLKRAVIELFGSLAELKNGQIALLEVKHGLPFRVEVYEHCSNNAAGAKGAADARPLNSASPSNLESWRVHP